MPNLVTTISGNLFELKAFSGLWLLDITLPEAFSARYAGPKFGMAGTRRLARVEERPLIGTIIKPSVGLDPEATAALVDALATGGIDFIKDDELLSDGPACPFEARVEVGRLMWKSAATTPLLAVGSQGVEYALVEHWRRTGLLPEHVATPTLTPARSLLVVSGSCSSITARQIAAAEAAGFVRLELALAAIDPPAWQRALQETGEAMLAHLAAGRNVLVATAREPDDPAVGRLNAALADIAPGPVHDRIGSGLGALVRRARLETGLKRAIVSGGDTSGQATLALGAETLVPICPLASGVPLMELLAADPAFDGMEIALKGGQMGGEDLFVLASSGMA